MYHLPRLPPPLVFLYRLVPWGAGGAGEAGRTVGGELNCLNLNVCLCLLKKKKNQICRAYFPLFSFFFSPIHIDRLPFSPNSY